MERATFIMSTGRTSTQFLHKLLSKGAPDVVVVHEGAGPHYKPAEAFRTSAFDEIVESTPKLKAHLQQIKDILADGQSFIDTGWPSYAWIPYLSELLGPQFRFAHLVRDPFSVSASLNSHRIFEDGAGMFRTHGIITSERPNVKFTAFKEDFASFNPFERGLLHWLEVNTYLYEHHDHPQFIGLFRFEDLYSADDTALRTLWQTCGFPAETFTPLSAYDAYQRPARQELVCHHQGLLKEVMSLALNLGYSEDYLRTVSNSETLQKKYAKTRLPLYRRLQARIRALWARNR